MVWRLLLWFRCCLGDFFKKIADCSSQLFCRRDLWYFCRHIGVAAVHVDDALIFVHFFLNYPKTLAIPFQDVMISTFSFFIFIMSTLFLCRFDSWDVLYPSKSLSIRWMSCCLFILFCLWYIFYALLTAFRRCFSSLGCVSLLWVCFFSLSMSLRNSMYSFDISSVSFAAAVECRRRSV